MELLRQLEIENYKTWERIYPPSEEMKAEKDCDPTLLNGWADKDISLWDVSDKEGRFNIDRILVALCKRINGFEKVGYIVFSDNVVTAAGLQLTNTSGGTGDNAVDSSRKHFEIKGITGKKLCTLLSLVSESMIKKGVYKKVDFDNYLWNTLGKYEKLSSAINMTRRGQASFIPPSGTQIVIPPSAISLEKKAEEEKVVSPSSMTAIESDISLNGTQKR